MVVLNFLLMAIVFGPSVSSLNLAPKELPFLKTQMNDEQHATVFNKLLNSIVNTNQKRLDTIKKLNKLQATDIHPSLEDPLHRVHTLRSTRRDSAESSDETNIIYLVIPETPNPTAQNTQRTIENHPNPPSTLPPIQPKPQPERLTPQYIPTLQDFAKFKASNPSAPLDARPSLSASASSALNARPSLSASSSLSVSPSLSASPSSSANSSLNASLTSSSAKPRSSIHSISKDGLDALRVSIARSCKSREVKKCKNACRAAVKNACEEYSCKKRLKKRLRKNCKRECKDEFRGFDEW